MEHTSSDGSVVPCTRSRLGRCRICELIDIHGPHYRADYHRMFRPEDFTESDADRERAKAEAEVEASRAELTPAPDLATNAGTLPLAGDLVAGLTSYLGVDRAMKWIERKTGRPCGCAGRQQALNRADGAARRLLKRLAGRSNGETSNRANAS